MKTNETTMVGGVDWKKKCPVIEAVLEIKTKGALGSGLYVCWGEDSPGG